MKKLFLVILHIIIPILLFAQTDPKVWNESNTPSPIKKKQKKLDRIPPKIKRTLFMFPEWTIGGGIGSSNSFTDIGGKEWEGKDLFTDVQLRTTKLSYGLFAEYRDYNRRMGYVISFKYGKVSGSDAFSPNTSRSPRNNSFTNNIFELGLNHKIYFFNGYNNGGFFRPLIEYYVYYGVNGFLNNPVLNDFSGYYSNQKKFSKVQVSVPFGLGLHYTFENHLRIGYDFGWRMTFTDYIDGFTTKFSQRNDSYAFTTLTIAYAFSNNIYKKLTNPIHKYKEIIIF